MSKSKINITELSDDQKELLSPFLGPPDRMKMTKLTKTNKKRISQYLKTVDLMTEKVQSACHVLALGAEGTGILTTAILMHPVDEFCPAYVDKEAAMFIYDVLTALLQGAPPEVSERLLKQQAERLSFDHE